MSPQQQGATAVTRALDAIAAIRVLLVGDLVLDAYLYGETVRVSREAPVIVVRKESLERRPGGAANTAANLRALGATTKICGFVGDDEAGTTVRGMLDGAGVDTSGLLTAPVTTAQKTRILAGAQGTSRQQVLRIDEEPAAHGPPVSSEGIERHLQRAASEVDVIVVSDYGLGAISGEVIKALRRACAAGTPVCVDSRHRLADFHGVTAVTPNLPEAERLVGRPIDDRDAAARAGRRIVAALGVRCCLLTKGRRGMTLIDAAGDNWPPVETHVDIVGGEEVTDVTGAGDTVVATFSLALAAGLGTVNAMRLANCAAGITVQRLGTTPAQPAEIIASAEDNGVELQPWAS